MGEVSLPQHMMLDNVCVAVIKKDNQYLGTHVFIVDVVSVGHEDKGRSFQELLRSQEMKGYAASR